MRFNVNGCVRVRLTDHGREVLRRDHEAFWREHGVVRPYSPPAEDAEGYSRWQLWVLMEKLGQYQGVAMPLVFEPEMIFEVPGEAGQEGE